MGVVVGVRHRYGCLSHNDLVQRARLILPLAGKFTVV